MGDVRRRRVPTNGVELDVLDAGPADGPLVVLVHGFPESSHAWRHQLPTLAAAGYRVLAPDQRGYARSSAPGAVDAYRVDHLSADLLGLLDDVGADDAVFVGHDWGALLVWDLARLHPRRVRGVVNGSVPYTPWPAPPTELLRALHGDRFFYILYFQEVGPAERELEADVHESLRTVLWSLSGDAYRPPSADELPMTGTGFLDALRHGRTVPAGLPPWLGPDDMAVFVDQFRASGFFGPVSWYRNLDADHALTKDLPHPSVPCAFIAGSHDPVVADRPGYVESMTDVLPDHRGTIVLDGVGHWTQQERPAAFDEALLDLLGRL